LSIFLYINLFLYTSVHIIEQSAVINKKGDTTYHPAAFYKYPAFFDAATLKNISRA
jgi:hypothetical protein